MKATLLGLWLVFGAMSVFAEEAEEAAPGRYQAVVIPSGGEFGPTEVFILDTQEGHIWKWSEYSTIEGVREGGRTLIYFGKVRPGEKFGEVLETQKF